MENHGITKEVLLPPAAGNPRNSEASAVLLKDGRLLLAYTRFTGRDMDGGSACIASRLSSDGGRTWTREDRVLVDNEGVLNVMSASLLRLNTGRIAVCYLVKNSQSDCIPCVRLSSDEGESWDDRVRVVSDEGYYGVNNDRLVELSSGRLLVPTHRSPGASGPPEAPVVPPCECMAYLSDDGGASWRRSTTVLAAPPGSKSGLQEPGVIELRDGSVMMFMRTDLGCQYRSFSRDGGESWGPCQPSDLRGPCSPAVIKRIPSTGDLLAIWNTPSPECRRKLPRCTLSSAISKDEGGAWENTKVLEHDLDGSFCYLSLLFTDDRAVMTYGHRHNSFSGGMLKLARADSDWFYV